MTTLAELLAAQSVILGDGAMGTELFAAGLESGASPELWNVEHAEKVMAVHRSYAQAGSNLILTNSFGGNRFRLKLHELDSRVHELNHAAAAIARQAVQGASQPVLIGGSVGPTGELLDPLGTMTFDEAVAAFAEQAAGLRDGGVDYFQVETMSDLREVEAAIQGIRQASDLPILATMSFDTNRHTMMGVKPETAARKLVALGVTALGANCGSGIADTLWAVQQMHNAVPEAILICKSNAGIPRYEAGGGLMYDGTPLVMADYAKQAQANGARIIGACCGSGPEHLRHMAAALGLAQG